VREALGEAFELEWDKCRISGHNYNDRSDVVFPDLLLRDLAPDGHAGDSQLVASSVVALHQHADGVAALFDIEHPGSGADATFEFVADHSGTSAHTSFFDEAGMSRIERMKNVLGLHVKTVYV